MSNKSVAIYYAGFSRFGGVNSHLRAMERALLRSDWDVVVITLDSLPFLLRYLPHIVEKLINLINRPLGFYYKGVFTKILYRLLFDYKTDIRIFEDIYLSWNSEIPTVAVLHAVWSDNLQAYTLEVDQVNKLKEKEISLIGKIHHPIITVSYPYRDYLVRSHFGRNISKKIDVVVLGVDQSQIKIDCAQNRKSIVYTGVLEARKNVFFLLKVYERLFGIDPSYRLTLIGDGPDKASLIGYAESHGLSVAFLGRLKHAEVLTELSKHGIYLHTSTKESFSYSLLEAKLAGLMTCAYEMLQVPPEFIDVGVSSFDIEEWCTAILSIDWKPMPFDANMYTVERMASSTLDAAL